MSDDGWQQAKDLFEAASRLEPEQRARFVEEACRGDAGLRAQVESLLLSHEQAPSFLEKPQIITAEDAAFEEADREAVGRRIGHYRIRRRIAAGGMGVVYLAEQENPQRTVALKLIRSEFASPAMLRRFEHEAHILGRLQHPGIAQIFEAGTADAEDGPRPYFAMEFVEGRSLTEYARAKSLGTRQRLELMTRICDAVQHAHQKGVVHRDLKPANILVDELGQPKVLDFGVARATDADVRTTTLRTDVGQLIGTLPYMSPEQVAGNPEDLDTQSDVYSLGVLCYELLAGCLPYEIQRKTIPEAIRVIGSQEPRPLSSINKVFRGDLETIVGKALEKERGRRYLSASDFSSDIVRYLRNEPITARPPSAAYQIRKLVARHRLPFALAGAIFLIVASSAIVATVQAARLTKERDRAERVNAYLQQMLAWFDPATAKGTTVTLKEVLDEADGRVERELAEQPLIAAALRETIGNGYVRLGLYDLAEPRLGAALRSRRAQLPADDPAVARSLQSLADLHFARSDYATAEPLYREALSIRRRSLGPKNPDVATSVDRLGWLLKERGDYPAAESALREALDIRRGLFGEEHLDIATSLDHVALLLHARGDHQSAEPFFREALAMRRKLLGEVHPEVALSVSNLAWILKEKGDYAESEPLYRDALEMRRKLFGEQHPDVALGMNNLGVLLHQKGDYAAAETLYREALEMRRRLLGKGHLDVAVSLANLGSLLSERGDPAAAEPMLREALAIRRNTLGSDHPDVADTLNNLGGTLYDKGDYAGAEQAFREGLEIERKILGDEHPSIAMMTNNLAATQRKQGKRAEAEAGYRRVLALKDKVSGADARLFLSASSGLASVLVDEGDYAEAEPLVRDALDQQRRLFGSEHLTVAASLNTLGYLLLAKGDALAAEAPLRESLEIRRKTLPAGHALIAQAQGTLGDCLSAQHRYSEAEPLLLESYTGSKAPQVARSLVELYTAWGRPGKAAPYRSRVSSAARQPG